MARSERDEITLWVANDEYFYSQVMRLYDKWVDEGDAWHEKFARRELEPIVEEIAEALFAKGYWDEPYTPSEKREAVDELLGDFDQYRDDELAERQKNAAAKPTQRAPMSQFDKDHAAKMEKRVLEVGVKQLPHILDHPVNMTEADVKKAGVEFLRGYMPVSQARVRRALETGDPYLNTISIHKWREMSEMFGYRNYRMSVWDGVDVLKHVATWYYA